MGYFFPSHNGAIKIAWNGYSSQRYQSISFFIKSANVFLTKNGVAKLGDMNVSKVIRKESMCETQTGTPYYASPEVWRD